MLERLHDAKNRHDLETFVGCFSSTYRSGQPCHPKRTFTGNARVRRNWGTGVAAMPDFRADLLQAVQGSDTLWTE